MKTLIIVIALIILIVIWSVVSPVVSCKARYADFQPTFGIISGCQLLIDGKRVPAENYRVM